MNGRFRFEKTLVALVITLTIGMLPEIVCAQEPGQGPPPGGFPGGPPPGGFPGGPPAGFPGGGGPGHRESSVASVPVEALTAALKLTDDQQKHIAAIQDQTRQQTHDLMPSPQDGPPDQEAMHANFAKIQDLNKKAQQQIEAILTAEQKKKLPTVLKELQMLDEAGIPAALIGDLKLTVDQKTSLTSVIKSAHQKVQAQMAAAQQNGDFGLMRDAMQQSREQTHDRAMGLLTVAQKKLVVSYMAAHPQPEPNDRPGPPEGPQGGPR